LRGLQKDTTIKLAESLNTVDAYTIKVKNLPEKNRVELRRELWKHFSQITTRGMRREYKIVDVQLAESQSTLDLQISLGLLRKKVI